MFHRSFIDMALACAFDEFALYNVYNEMFVVGELLGCDLPLLLTCLVPHPMACCEGKLCSGKEHSYCIWQIKKLSYG